MDNSIPPSSTISTSVAGQSNIKTTDSSKLVSPDSPKFKPSVTFFGYTIYFLYKPIIVKLQDAVTLKTCKFGHLVRDISDENISTVDEAFNSVLTYDLSIDPDSFFIKKYNKWNACNDKGRRIKTLPDECRTNIQIKITGYKCSSTNKSSPMLEIHEIKEVEMEFV